MLNMLEALGLNKESFELFFNLIPSAIFAVDKEKRVRLWNRKAEEITGYSSREMLGKKCIIFAEEPCKDKCGLFSEDVKKPIPAKECTIRRKDGESRTILKNSELLRDGNGNIIGGIESFEDITERKRTEERLRLIDSHTGLYNHHYLQQAMEAEFERARRHAHPLTVVMLDIDYFKSINDVYGYQFGDLVLKQFAKQLKRMLRSYDIIIRSGGEEFIIISPGTPRPEAVDLAQRLLDAVNIFNFGDKKHTVKLKLSLAIATYPDDGITKGAGLINLADQILNKAKESGGNRVYSSTDIKKQKPSLPETRRKNVDINLLRAKIDKLNKKANQSLVEAIFAFAKTIELKDHYTGEHVENTVHYATEIAMALNLAQHEIELVRQASILHDLGKVGISDNILHKKSKLSKKEFEEIRKHPQIGADIIRPIQFLHDLIPFIFYHHERWDGKGYPSGIKGEEIPIGARIIAIADVYQALSSDRPYRKAYSRKEAIKIIKSYSGTQFDPRIVDIFLKILQEEK